MSQTENFQIERLGPTIVVTPLSDLHDVDCDALLACDPAGAIKHLESQQATNVIIDCRNLKCCCSSGIAVFIRLGNQSQASRGRMAFCHVSDSMHTILEVTKLTTLWPIFASISGAIAYVEEGAATMA